MKNSKKAIGIILVIVLLCTLAFSFTACNKMVVETDTETVINITKSYYKDGDTLKTYMDRLVENDKLSYEMTSGMVISINDRKADVTNNEYWFIYTSDTEYSNMSWGAYTYDGKEYGSAILGISDLPIKLDETYIFVISKL